MANSTLAELIEHIRDSTREPVEGFFTNDELTRYINLVSIRMSRESGLTFRTVELTWDTGFMSADLPSDYYGVKKVFIQSDDGSVKRVEKRGMLGRSKTSLIGSGYYLEGSKIYFTTDHSADTVMKLQYIFLPVEFVDYLTDIALESSIPMEFTETLIHGVSAKCFFKKREETEARREEGMFKGEIADIRRSVNSRDGESVRNINL